MRSMTSAAKSRGPGKVKPSPLNGDAGEGRRQVERIERLVPSQMMPDRFQPRRLLPAALRAGFLHRHRSTATRPPLEWLAMARADPGTAAEVERSAAMGSSFDEHGQIKSITGKWVTNAKGEFVFQIETGERRFWAACLQHVSRRRQEEPLLRVEVVEHPTRQRQVLENRHAEPPSAVEQACEVASLILAELNMTPDADIPDDYDFFRQARTQRMPAGLWERIMPIMQLTRPRMVQLLNILQFSTPLLDLADRYRLSERVLREILSAPREQWERMIKLSIQNQLTSDEVAEYTVPPLPTDNHPAPPGTSHPARTRTPGCQIHAALCADHERTRPHRPRPGTGRDRRHPGGQRQRQVSAATARRTGQADQSPSGPQLTP